MKKIIALALVLVMLFALSACGKKEEAPVATEAPEIVAAADPVEATPEAVIEPIVTPEPTPVGIEYDSGLYIVTSEVNGISFEYDSKYIAMRNPVGNISVFAGIDDSIPYVTVALFSDTDAVSYLNEIIEGSKIELGDSLVTAPEAPAAVTVGEKEVQHISYSYSAAETEGNITCAYYAENLEDGKTVVYSYVAVEGSTEDVESIVNLAIETFELAEIEA